MDFLCKVEVPTATLKVEHIQELLVLVKDKSSSINLTKDFWGEVVHALWHHLKTCLGNLDDQLLCATCFYSVITLVSQKDQDYYMEKLLHVVGHESNSLSRFIRRSMPGSKRLPFGIELSPNSDHIKSMSTSTLRVVSLIYGLFQSTFLTKTDNDKIFKISEVLKEILNLLLSMGYEYSDYTFLVFKIIKSFRKVCGGRLEKYIFNNENNLKLLALVNNNWENPITGVRDLNRSIFQTVISTLDKVTYDRVSKDIEGFYWNKAKYLMLSETLESYTNDILLLIIHKWIDGVVYSLYKPGLVSAGADMYYALLKKINNQDYWCQFFLLHVLKILSGSCIKAIENFCNYWCLTTIKKFRTLSNVLIDELDKVEYSDQVLYSKLGVLRQANKLGVLDKNWSSTSNNITNYVLAGINNYNSHVRILAFDIICVSQGKSIPTVTEYNLILEYLSCNLNSDSTVLRISMLNSLNYFLTQLHSASINVITKRENTEALENLLSFCGRLQGSIANNIMANGNYQRKITSVKLCNTILNCFTTTKRKKGNVLVKQENVSLIDFLKEKNCWFFATDDFINKLISLLNDPAEDVRDNVIKILLGYFRKELQNDIILKEIMDNAQKCIQSKFFYEISCGHSMFKLIVNLLITKKDNITIKYKSTEEIFDFAFNELIKQHAAKTNVMDSIEKGQQLHSYMSILLVVLEECITNSYTLTSFGHDKMSSILQVLENVSNQFVWEEEKSSDFSEMNNMIRNIVLASDYSSLDKDDHTKISGLQQIVLNCLWLNVKASCDLAAILIRYNVDDVIMCQKCINIITRVLETSRHKGAIEAAGTALGKGMNYLTSLLEKKIGVSSPSSGDVTKLPYALLKCKLNDLISETSKMSSVTRRGAGLSIMLHRIVSNDMKKGKPLFHYFIKTLLQKCKHPVAVTSPFVSGRIERMKIKESNSSTDKNVETQLDLPAAIYIHFMTRIVTDRSLATDVMYYSAELAELAFGNLTSSHWQIRNAALQLYGALIPRLIGQKKASGTDDETIATVACDEMLTHSPELWKYIIKQLKQSGGENLLQTHSNLVPILNLLANSAKRYHFSLPVTESDTEIVDLFYHLVVFLGSPIYTVRRLTAKTIFNIYEFQYISDFLLKQENVTENLLHGMLMLLKLCHNYYACDVRNLRDTFKRILGTGQHSYLCKTLYEDVFAIEISMTVIENTLLEWNSNTDPGIHTWAENRIRQYIDKCPWSDIPNLLNLLLAQCNYNDCVTTFLGFLLSRIEKDMIIPTEVLLQQIANNLIAFEKKYSCSIIWRMLYEISRRTSLRHCIDTAQLLKNLKPQTYNLRYIVPLVARHVDCASNEDKHILLKVIHDFSDFETSDVVMRYVAAIANNELSYNFNELLDSLKVISIKCAVLLLQDEDEDIRNLSVNFYCIIFGENRLLQPYICLNRILDKSFLHLVFIDPEKSIEELKRELTAIVQFVHKVDGYNPFANQSKNIYFEMDIFKDMVENLNIHF